MTVLLKSIRYIFLRIYALNGFSDSGQLMIMLKHNQHHLITFSICSSGCYKSHTAGKQNINLVI